MSREIAWRRRGLLGWVVLAATSWLSCRGAVRAPVVGGPVSEVVLADLQGRTFRLSEQKGKVVLINFWASWCPPCVEEMPSLERLHRALGGKGLEVVGISVDEESDVVKRFREEHGLSFLVLHDPGAKVSHAFGTFKFPETYIVNRQGNLAAKVIGAQDWIAPVVMHDLLGLLKSGGPS